MPFNIRKSTMRQNYRAIITLGLPILIGQVGMILVGFADNIMVGRYSTEALASASFVNNLFNVAIFACIGFTYGLTPLVGALFGQKRQREIGALMRNGLAQNALFGLLITAVMGVIYLNVERLGQPEELMPILKPYYALYLAGLLPVILFNAFAQWAYAITNTKLPMWIILISNVLNVAGNYVLIYGKCGMPELGLFGAGVSTFIARWLCPIAFAAVFFFKKEYREYREGFIHSQITKNQQKLVLKTSLPVSIQLSLESGSFTAAAIMTGWLGAVPLAAYQIIVITGTLGFCVYYSIGSAVSVLVSNEAGRGDKAAQRRVAWAGYHIMLVLMTLASLTFWFGGEWLMSAFTSDSMVLATAVGLIVPLIFYQLGDATQITFANALRGTSNVMPLLWIAFVCYVIIGIPATYILAFPMGLGIYGIVLSFSVSLFSAGALFLATFLKTTKK